MFTLAHQRESVNPEMKLISEILCIAKRVAGHKVNSTLVLKAVDRCRDSSTSLYKRIAGEGIYRHDRCIAKKSAKLNSFAYAFANYRDQTYCSCLLV